MESVFQIESSKKGFIHLDPRTKLLILLIGNLTVFLSLSLKFEVTLAFIICAFGIFCGMYKFSIKMAAVYMLLVTVQILSPIYLNSSINVILVSFVAFARKIFPCTMLGGILVGTTGISEFMAAMNKIHMPKSIVIPLTIMLRYFPVVKEDWNAIKNAMKMRDVSPSFKNFITHPMQTMECIYVPMMLSGSRIADDLSAAAITRGIENPKQRSCLQKVELKLADYIFLFIFIAVFIISFV
jgi:energy-coupling factor transport system permease protein